LTGSYYGCVEDDKNSGAGVDVEGSVPFDYSPSLCFQDLNMNAPIAGSTHAYLTDNITFAFTETCLDLLNVYYCTQASTSTSVGCASNTGGCTAVGTVRSGESDVDSLVSVYTYSFVLQGDQAVTGYQYACVQDTTNSLAYAYSPQFCVQQLVLAYTTGTSDGTNLASDGYTYDFVTFSATGYVDTLTFSWTETCGEVQALYVCTDTALMNPCTDFMASGICFETVYNNGEGEITGNAGSDSFSIPATALSYYTSSSGSAGGTTALWQGPLYFCIEDYNIEKTDTTTPLATSTISDAFDYDTAYQYCIQWLTFSDVTGTSGDSSSSTTYALAGTAGVVDIFTWSWTETCAVNQRIWYCTSLTTSSSCEDACTVISASTTSTGSAVSTSATAAQVGATGYMYFCVQDTSESDAYVWMTTQYCIQNMAMTSITGGSNSGTFAHNAGINVDTITLAWSVTCNVQHSVYQCSSYDTGNICSSSAGCTLIGSMTSTTTTPTYSVIATALNTGNLYFCVQDTTQSNTYDYYESYYCLQDMALGTVYGTYYGEANYGFMEESVSFPLTAAACGHPLTVYSCLAAGVDTSKTCLGQCEYIMGTSAATSDTVTTTWIGAPGTYYACMVDDTDSTMFTWTTSTFTIY
jgi:hypothetical protein